jgi:hypothetical protein
MTTAPFTACRGPGPVASPSAAWLARSARQPRRALLAVVAVLTLTSLPACKSDPTLGYSTEETFNRQVSTVAVPIFTNTTFVRDVQFELADTLTKEILNRTPWRIASSTEADTILVGTITAVELRRIAKSPTTGLAEQDTYSIVLDFEWRDQRTGQTLLKRTGFSTSGLFVPTITSNDPIDFGRWNAVQSTARDIVDLMRNDW